MKIFVIRTGLVLASTLITLAAAELILRQFYKFPQPQFLELDPILGHRLRPNIEGYFAREGLGYVRINSHGFRDREYTVDKTQKKRIVVLGDSYTLALQVDIDDTFHELLEAEFEETLEVLNFGVAGYGTAQQLLAYRHFAKKFKPDIVVLAFYPGNDFRDNVRRLSSNYPRPYYSLEESGWKLDISFRKSDKHLRPKFIYDFYYFLTDNSIVFSLLDRIRYRRGSEETAARAAPVGARFTEKSDIIYGPKSKEHLAAWSLTEKLILELADTVKRDGAKFVLFVLDTLPEQIELGRNTFYVEKRLGRLCLKRNLICSFMAPAAIQYQKATGRTIHGFDGKKTGHWNPTGHRIAKEALRHSLLESGLIP